jgi:hypothetical protein
MGIAVRITAQGIGEPLILLSYLRLWLFSEEMARVNFNVSAVFAAIAEISAANLS